jgi:electron transport complex protein RnfD
MINQKKLIVSHAPFWHDGSRITPRSYNTMIAALPAVLFGIYLYGFPALGVIALSVSSAIFWEFLMNKVMKRSVTIGDGNAALIGLVLAMLVPATFPWWAVLTGTFVAIVIGKQIFGGIGGNAFNPVVVSIAILMISWKDLFNFNEALASYTLNFEAAYPLASLKHFGMASIDNLALTDLLFGKQTGGVGATCGLALIIGGLYLILRGFIRWEIVFSFLAGVFITALIFNLTDPTKYAGPAFHLLTGYTLVGAFFLVPEDASSPVNFIPMLIYGAVCGLMTVLIRNIGVYVDGVIYAVLIANLVSPLLDKIRPEAMGKVV